MKIVFSKSLKETDWQNTRIVKDHAAEELRELKQQLGQDITIASSNRLVHSLMQNDLIDECRLLTYPVFPGSGKRLFGGANKATLRPVETRLFR